MRLTDPLRPLSQLLEELRERESRMHDSLVPARNVSIDSDTGHLLVRNGRTTSHRLQSQAFDLLCGKLRTPASYLRRIPHWLAAENLNFHLRARPSRELLLRFESDECRAVLSSRYRCVSHVQLAETLHRKSGNVLVRAEMDPLRLLMQVVNGRSVEASPGDRLHGGMHVRNSEVGYMAVELRALIWRQVCLNGLIMSSSDGVAFRRRHVTEPTEVLARFGLAAERAVEAGAFLPKQFADTKLIRIPDIKPVFERIISRYGLDDAEHDAIWNAWNAEPGKTLYAVINSLTRAGNNPVLSVNSREKLQRTGGRILELAERGTSWID